MQYIIYIYTSSTKKPFSLDYNIAWHYSVFIWCLHYNAVMSYDTATCSSVQMRSSHGLNINYVEACLTATQSIMPVRS